MEILKSAIWLTREQVAEIVDTFNVVLQDDTSLEGITVLMDPDTVTVAEWEIRPEVHPFIAL